MKHFIFLFYIMSYTIGIVAIALLNIQFLRYNKLKTLRDLILFCLSFTLYLVFETLNFYFTIIINYYSAWFQIFILLGSLAAAVGMAYFLGTYVYRMLGREFNHTFKAILGSGIYHYLRHPAYLGSLLAFLGLALYFGNWITFMVIFIPVFGAFFWRMVVEEQVLTEQFGPAYLDYAKKTPRLIPKIF